MLILDLRRRAIRPRTYTHGLIFAPSNGRRWERMYDGRININLPVLHILKACLYCFRAITARVGGVPRCATAALRIILCSSRQLTG